MVSDEVSRRQEVENLLEDITFKPEPGSPEHNLTDKYNVQVRYMGNSRAFSFPEYRVIVLPKDDEQGERVYKMLHELVHIEKEHPPKGDSDPFTILRWEAEAWRWAREAAKTLGYDIPGEIIKKSMGSYVENAGLEAKARGYNFQSQTI